MIGNLVLSRWMRHRWRRRLTFVVLIAIFAMGSIWPQRYRASATVLPLFATGPTTPSVVSGTPIAPLATQIAIEIGRRAAIIQTDAQAFEQMPAHLRGSQGLNEGWIAPNVDVRPLRDGLVRISAAASTPAVALRRVTGIAHAMSMRMAGSPNAPSKPSGQIVMIVPPAIETNWQIAILPASLSLLSLFICLAMEAYLMRPPLEAYRGRPSTNE